MKEEIKLNENEKLCLSCLTSVFGGYEGEFCMAFKTISGDTKLEVKAVRRAVRSLARKGLAKFYRGLMTEDGEVAGAGYTATEKGCELRDLLKI